MASEMGLEASLLIVEFSKGFLHVYHHVCFRLFSSTSEPSHTFPDRLRKLQSCVYKM